MRNMKKVLLVVLGLTLGACGGIATTVADTPAQKVQKQIDERANGYAPYMPPFPSPELKNYERAQRLYADPNTIQWCTSTWGNASAPLFTVPVAGKLTSSSVSFFPSSRSYRGGGDTTSEFTPERRSLDSMYHGSPPPYRFGFTPGGQYVDFFNMPTFCTTQPTKFQRQKTELALTVDDALNQATQQAEQQLKAGDGAGAQATLEQAIKAAG